MSRRLEVSRALQHTFFLSHTCDLPQVRSRVGAPTQVPRPSFEQALRLLRFHSCLHDGAIRACDNAAKKQPTVRKDENIMLGSKRISLPTPVRHLLHSAE